MSAPDLTSLTDDGDTLDLGSGLHLRLRIEGDDSGHGWNDQMDAECYGAVEWVRGRERPPSFDGAARIVGRDGSDTCWWQPPTAEAIGTVWSVEQWAKQTQYVRDRIEYGWWSVGLELRETLTDSYSGEHTVTVDTRWLGGVDDVSAEYLPEVLADLWAELDPEAES